uniref:Uncharacterized protein n=1 Tax=Heterorhabditis bacteriophora TaxID=37862 RepID=A0A1I7WH80_HETBA
MESASGHWSGTDPAILFPPQFIYLYIYLFIPSCVFSSYRSNLAETTRLTNKKQRAGTDPARRLPDFETSTTRPREHISRASVSELVSRLGHLDRRVAFNNLVDFMPINLLIVMLRLLLILTTLSSVFSQMTFSDGWEKRSIPFVHQILPHIQQQDLCNADYSQGLVKLHQQMMALHAKYKNCQAKRDGNQDI